MKRRVFGILAALSLLLFAAVVWAWVRSFDEDVALLAWKWSRFRASQKIPWSFLAPSVRCLKAAGCASRVRRPA